MQWTRWRFYRQYARGVRRLRSAVDRRDARGLYRWRQLEVGHSATRAAWWTHLAVILFSRSISFSFALAVNMTSFAACVHH